jgi:uncharacterized protein
VSNLPLTADADGVVVTVKLTPRARRAGIEGIAGEPGVGGERPVLKLRVTAPPEDGKANAAMIELLAKSWRLPKTAFTIVSGETQRLKRVHVRGTPASLLSDLTARMERI